MQARFHAANNSLQVRAGLLGPAQNYGSGHKAICTATKDMYEAFCTSSKGVPGQSNVTQPKLDDKLLDHLRTITEVR